MLQKNYDILVRNGKEQFVVVPRKDYEALLSRLEDEEDFRALQAAKKRNARQPLIPHGQVVSELGLTSRRKSRKA